MEQVKAEHLSSGGLFKEIVEAADLYGVFEDLYGRDKFFRPCVQLKIRFDFDDEYVTPVHRGTSTKTFKSSNPWWLLRFHSKFANIITIFWAEAYGVEQNLCQANGPLGADWIFVGVPVS